MQSEPERLLGMQNLADMLEKHVDDHDLNNVLEALSMMCFEKAGHVLQYTDSAHLSKAWETMGQTLFEASHKATQLGFGE